MDPDRFIASVLLPNVIAKLTFNEEFNTIWQTKPVNGLKAVRLKEESFHSDFSLLFEMLGDL